MSTITVITGFGKNVWPFKSGAVAPKRTAFDLTAIKVSTLNSILVNHSEYTINRLTLAADEVLKN